MVSKEILDGFEIYTLQNEKMTAYLCPALGNNLYRLWDQVTQSEVLRTPKNLNVLKEKAIYYGIPVLFPPNRTRFGRFEFQGRVYQLDINWENKHNNHGFLAWHPWKVAATMQIGNSQSVTSTFATVDFPDVLRQYPHDLFFSMTYDLSGSTLTQKVSITNRGTVTAPVGFGLHPWFHIGYEPEKWMFTLPVSYEWELDSELMPTGKLMNLGSYELLTQGMNVKYVEMEKLFSIGSHPHMAVLSRKDYEIRIQTSKLYKYWLIYTMGETDKIISIEPYTWVTNAPNLSLPPELTGIIALRYGETINLTTTIDITHQSDNSHCNSQFCKPQFLESCNSQDNHVILHKDIDQQNHNQNQGKDSPYSYYTEKYRPQLHFSPARNWINDPNGLVYHKGKYHMFYQYKPYGDKWGNVSWGHAVSKDLVHWEQLRVALTPDELGPIFSGSIVVDRHNTSGLFKESSEGLVAIYTSAGEMQQQSLAYSTDEGITWTKYKGNPVIPNPGIKDFRDPKVMWYEKEYKWIMALAAGDHIQFYSSKNLTAWKYMSRFGENEGSHGGVWEVPELIELPVDNDPNNTKWLLKVDINPGSVAGGSGGQYFIGAFDGMRFINENPPNEIRWVDYGKDFYAAQTWFNTGSRKVWIGWMNNWQYADVTPTNPWRGAMSLPRELALKTFRGEGVKLIQMPVKELKGIRKNQYQWKNEKVMPGKNILSSINGKTVEIAAEFELGSASEFGFKVRKSAAEETVIGYDTERHILFVDRTYSGEFIFSPAFAGRYEAILNPIRDRIKLHIFVDWSSVEVFGNAGEIVFTDLIFPNPSSNRIELYSENGYVKLSSLIVNELESIWQ
ncbi:aldose epimerase family protein [Ectobacillus funiculus]|uniref:GH32 C-terminal domain-containing protein n=1 Tax=Ectobacillus funiculus TaxID=137993 RepID=A0ABV5WD16_9BACI